MILSPVQSVEESTEEVVPKAKVQELKPPPPPKSRVKTFLRKELEFLGVTQTIIGLMCFFFGITHILILKYLDPKIIAFSSFSKGYPIWGGLLFTIFGFLLISLERKYIKYLVQSSLVLAILSSVIAGAGINILSSNLNETLSVLKECPNHPMGDFCFTAHFLTETAVIVLLLTVLELGIGILLPVGEIIGKLEERWIIKHRKAYQEALYEELPVYDPIGESIELETRESVPTGRKETRRESSESLQSRVYQSPEELQEPQS
ncbi:high affinity immunoglobulin epsilon receptor subunit beta [Sarcophilus harrisii]|uniref:Membrane spanning 4-domains A2 n=1 Tax=Sarcophilus harrisii TaxID=9305 RepID=G3VRN5_SARHA|nr:high affinity immunoglobulin epsilon receptor subunit beta [Sarcophilus harrisii]